VSHPERGTIRRVALVGVAILGVLAAPGPAETKMTEQRATRFTNAYADQMRYPLRVERVRVASPTVAHVKVWDAGIVVGSEVLVPLTVKVWEGRFYLWNPLMSEWWNRRAGICVPVPARRGGEPRVCAPSRR
jgi:hypothetical protein